MLNPDEQNERSGIDFNAERERLIEDHFPDRRLREEFGLSLRESIFSRAYAATMNACYSAQTAGYSDSMAKERSYQLLRKEKISAAIDAIMYEAVHPLIARRNILYMSDSVARLHSIVRNGSDKDAINAAKAIHEFIEVPVIALPEKEVAGESVPDDEVIASLKRMGVTGD